MPIPAGRRNAVVVGARARMIAAIEAATGEPQASWGQTPQARRDAWANRCDRIHDGNVVGEPAHAVDAVDAEMDAQGLPRRPGRSQAARPNE